MPPKKPAGKPSTKKLTNTNKGAKKAAKKWSKGKSREALANAVMFDAAALAKLESEVPKYKVITPSIVSDRLKVSVSVAGAGLRHLLEKKLVKLVSCSSKMRVYTRAIEAEK